jgi:hypothetical protein
VGRPEDKHPVSRRRAVNRSMDNLVDVAIPAVARHPSVIGAELAGSRSRGTHEELADWDFAVRTSDFEAVARALPTLVEPLEPLGAQWEPLGHFPVYALMLRGPTVVEYLFLEHSQQAKTPVEPSEETLPTIDAHFWAWIWWLAAKANIGRDDLLNQHWPRLYRHMLRPMGASTVPDSIDAAIRSFLTCRGELEREHGAELPRELEREVRRGIRRLGYRGG